MKYIATIILGAIALFFGIYAMVLELNGASPMDQMFWCMLFGLMTYWSRSFPLPQKALRFFNKKYGSDELTEKVFDYFKIEKTGNETCLYGDFKDKGFKDWLNLVHHGIQHAMETRLFDGNKVENYTNITFYIGGQRVDISLVKDGKKSPHELLQELKGEKTDDIP